MRCRLARSWSIGAEGRRVDSTILRRRVVELRSTPVRVHHVGVAERVGVILGNDLSATVHQGVANLVETRERQRWVPATLRLAVILIV